MNLIIRTCLLLPACIAIVNGSLANDGHVSPSPLKTSRFMASVKVFDAMNKVTASAKVCVCQILNLRSTNHHVKNAVVFAEKTNMDGADDLAQAKLRLEKEKRLLRVLFYSKIQVVAKTTAATDCNTLFKQLKKKQDNLLLYEMLDADVEVK